ncbi:hypothetical protein P8452_16853 [Trifolium repens]|nr:hypothetical protein P8452_16853 [Trifolium repens]
MPENKVENRVELVADSMQENPCKMSTQVISVSGIINKYFSEGEKMIQGQGSNYLFGLDDGYEISDIRELQYEKMGIGSSYLFRHVEGYVLTGPLV